MVVDQKPFSPGFLVFVQSSQHFGLLSGHWKFNTSQDNLVVTHNLWGWLKARKEISFINWNSLFNCLLDVLDVTQVNCLKEEHSSRKLVESSTQSSRDYLAPAKSSYLEVNEWDRKKGAEINGHKKTPTPEGWMTDLAKPMKSSWLVFM